MVLGQMVSVLTIIYFYCQSKTKRSSVPSTAHRTWKGWGTYASFAAKCHHKEATKMFVKF